MRIDLRIDLSQTQIDSHLVYWLTDWLADWLTEFETPLDSQKKIDSRFSNQSYHRGLGENRFENRFDLKANRFSPGVWLKVSAYQSSLWSLSLSLSLSRNQNFNIFLNCFKKVGGQMHSDKHQVSIIIITKTYKTQRTQTIVKPNNDNILCLDCYCY